MPPLPSYFYFAFSFVSVCASHGKAHVRRPVDSLWSSYHVCPRDGTHAIRVSGRHLPLLSHCTEPFIIYFESESHAVAQADLILFSLENILALTVISFSACRLRN